MESPAFRTPCGGIELDEPELANMIAASMYPSNVRHLLISAAFLLTVAGPLSVFCGSEFRGMGGPPAAGLVSEVEDADVDQRDDTSAVVWVPSVQIDLHVSISSCCRLTWRDVPIVCGPHNERGPPTFYL